MPSLNVNGIELYYEEYGHGDEVIISAQSHFEEECYQKDIAKMSDKYKVYLITLRGYGKSTHVYEDLGNRWLDIWADDIYQFSRLIGIDQFIYTGVSHGAGVGWYLSLKYPESIRAFISVVGVPHDRSGGDTSKQRLETIAGAGKANFEGPTFFMVPTEDPVRKKRQDEIRKNRIKSFREMSEEELRIHVRKPFPECKTNEELAEKLSEVKVPTLLLCGCQDDIISADISFLAAKSVPGAKSIFYQDHSHTLAAEARELVANDVLQFLKGLRNRKTVENNR